MELDKKELKLQAYRESFETKIASTVGDYEERIADLRVELTIMSYRVQELEQRLAEKESPDAEEKSENTSPQE